MTNQEFIEALPQTKEIAKIWYDCHVDDKATPLDNKDEYTELMQKREQEKKNKQLLNQAQIRQNFKF